jgi:hypothetical protein
VKIEQKPLSENVKGEAQKSNLALEVSPGVDYLDIVKFAVVAQQKGVIASAAKQSPALNCKQRWGLLRRSAPRNDTWPGI